MESERTRRGPESDERVIHPAPRYRETIEQMFHVKHCASSFVASLLYCSPLSASSFRGFVLRCIVASLRCPLFHGFGFRYFAALLFVTFLLHRFVTFLLRCSSLFASPSHRFLASLFRFIVRCFIISPFCCRCFAALRPAFTRLIISFVFSCLGCADCPFYHSFLASIAHFFI